MPPSIDQPLYPWQESAWSQLRAMQEHLPHALLLHGQTGIGKRDFAQHLAQSLLCEQTGPEGHACGACVSCRWFLDRAHMDFRLLRPEAMDVAEGIESEEGEAEPDSASDEKKSKKAPSKEIKIEQVRTLARFLNIGTHRGGRRIVLLYPLRAMNVYTANALLKMLEEPPPQTVFLLISDGLERILPTILSRCRHMQMPVPDRAAALSWLKADGIASADAETALAEQGGSPLAARAQLLDPETSGTAAQRKLLFDYLSRPDKLDPLQVAEQLAPTELPTLLGWLQRWQYDCVSYSSAQRIRYYPAYETKIAALVGALGVPSAKAAFLTLDKKLTQARRVVNHPLYPKLFLESLLLDYAEHLGRVR